MRLRAILFSAILCLPLCLPTLSFAQQETSQVATRGTIFGGYSLLHSSNDLGSTSLGGTNFNLGGSLGGWEGQGTFNFTRHFGVTADFSGNSKQLAGISGLGFSAGTQQHMYNMLFGPTVTGYFGKSSVFGHALFGVALSSLSAGVSVPILGGISAPLDNSNAFAMAFGGGIDIGLSRHFAIRAAQLDYIRTNFNTLDSLTGLTTGTSTNQNNFRYSGGVIWRF